MLSMEQLKKIGKFIEEAEKLDAAMEETKEEVKKPEKEETKEEVKKHEKEETTDHIHTKAMSPDELITQTRTIYDSELVDYTIWCEGVTLYTSLRYKVATDVGEVDLLYPKVVLLTGIDELPEVFVDQDQNFKIRTRYRVFSLCDAKHPDYPSLDEACVFEHMDKAPEREMTVAEIEKELGYKVKVVGGPYDKREK